MNMSTENQQWKFSLEALSAACPESYDAFLDGKRVGHIKLRYGRLTVWYDDVGGEIVLRKHLQHMFGLFADAEDRHNHLIEACEAIRNHIEIEINKKEEVPKNSRVSYHILGAFSDES